MKAAKRPGMAGSAKLARWAEEHGYQVAAVPIAAVPRARRELRRLLESGELGRRFFAANLRGLIRAEKRGGFRPRFLVLVAVPRPAHLVHFTFRGRRMNAVIPPTYVRYRPLFAEVCADFAANVSGPGVRTEIASIPLKTAAAISGLVRYGRNNVCYAGRFGSFFQLIGLATEMDLGGAEGKARIHPVQDRLHPACENCDLCRRACPAGAITADRFLLQAERCYTLHSESPSPIPAGMRPPSPGCLVGCLKCQTVCPLNRGLLRLEASGVSFTAAETELLLGLTPGRPQSLPATVEKKFGRLGLSEAPALFARNLQLIIRPRPPC